MKGDFTRSTFRARKHHTSVRMQQGRVQLDADWNEQVDITRHRIETGTLDTLGPQGAPVANAGFGIMSSGELGDPPTGEPGDGPNFGITPGRYYVDGILCENEALTTYREQPDRVITADDATGIIGAHGWYLAYLDVWTRHITVADDDELREPALGGADTTTRTRTVWQVRCAPLDSPDDLPEPGALPAGHLHRTTGTMEARIRGTQRDNRLYRIEVHQDGPQEQARFKWSRDNGAVVAVVDRSKVTQNSHELPILTGSQRLQPGDHVELLTAASNLETFHGRLFEVQAVTKDQIALDQAHELSESDLASPVTLRRWDVQPWVPAGSATPTLALTGDDDDWIHLENEVRIRFSPGEYRSGDYWYVPVRTGLAVSEDMAPEPPDGVTHHVAHLALIHVTDGDIVTVERDLRRRFVPPGEERRLVYGGGGGQVAPRGELLPLPLTVHVTGYLPNLGATVRFSLPSASSPGMLYHDESGTSGGDFVEVATDESGKAECYWEVSDVGSDNVPEVTAVLLDASGQPQGQPVTFQAWVSNADRVRFERSARAQDAGTASNDVQAALDKLYESVATIHFAGGDGQIGRPGEILPYPLRVRLASGTWPAGTPFVRFTVISGAGALSGDSGEPVSTLDVQQEGDVFQCGWILGADEPQEVRATLFFSSDNPGPSLSFTASIDHASEAAYETDHNANVKTVNDALDDLYEQVAILHYVGGDGQAGPRGDILPQPLTVQLTGYTPRQGWRVRFELPSDLASGDLYAAPDGSPVKNLLIQTDAEGRAACYWAPGDLDDDGAVPPVTATLLDDQDSPIGHPIVFHASLANADRVRFELNARAQEAAPASNDVQAALDTLYDSAAIIHYAGGDGQSARPGATLPLPLRVRLANGLWRSDAGAPIVRFSIASGKGSLSSGADNQGVSVNGRLVDGVFECDWTLGTDELQEVEATLIFHPETPEQAEGASLRFSASINHASESAYETDHNPSVATVAQALDDLYEQVAILHYVGGDGQAGPRGDILPQPLTVQLTGYTPRQGWRVRFELPSDLASGDLYAAPGGSSVKTLLIQTDAEGRAACYWAPGDLDDDGAAVPPVTATLLDDQDSPIGHPIVFHASLANADRVRFELSERAQEAHPDSNDVQAALDNLYDTAAIIHYVGGDGQIGRPGELLPYPLRVRIANGLWSHGPNPPIVRFSIVGDQGSLSSETGGQGATVDGHLVDGMFECDWTLGTDEPQEVKATLILRPGTPDEAEGVSLRFCASIDHASESAYQTDHNASVATVAQALDDLYEQVAILHYVGGDGQAGPRGDILPQPLTVQLTGYTPRDDWQVKFELPEDAPGSLHATPGAPASTELLIHTDAEGRAACYWAPGDLDGDGLVPPVTATLLDAEERPVGHPIVFHASLANADRLRFELGARTQEAAPASNNVQAALDTLYDSAAIIHYAGGDGQSARPGETLPLPLRVRLANGLWDHGPNPPIVRFSVTSGEGSLSSNGGEPATMLDVQQEAGVFECDWTLGNDARQKVEATLILRPGMSEEAEGVSLRFCASIDHASESAYETDHNVSVATVAQALDDLYEQGAGFADSIALRALDAFNTEHNEGIHTVHGALHDLYEQGAGFTDSIALRALDAFETEHNESVQTVHNALDDLYTRTQPASLLVPVGTILEFAGEDPPDGFLLCDGSEVAHEEYPDLFIMLGTTWGEASESHLFVLPDFRDSESKTIKIIKY